MNKGDEGMTAIELLIAAPVMVIMILLVVGGSRYADAKMEVTSASAEAARAASLTRDLDAAHQAGRDAARRTLDSRGKSCATLTVEVDVSSYEPGGFVAAKVTCTTDVSDLAMAGLPGATFTARTVVPIEQYRER